MVISWGFVVEWGFMVMKKVPWLMGSSHGNYIGDGIFTDEPIFLRKGIGVLFMDHMRKAMVL
jgi:hypothetical protein